MDTEQIRAELAKQGKVAIIWSTDDVLTVRENLTDEEAMLVLQEAERRHDANCGISWDTIEGIADLLFPESEERNPDETSEGGKHGTDKA